jgi:hypothetical protein
MSDLAWKAFERRVCQLFGTRRRGQVVAGGWAAGSDDDGSGPFALEIKYVSRFGIRRPWLKSIGTQPDGRPGFLVQGEHGKPVLESLTVMRTRQALELLADAGWLPEPRPFDASNGSDTSSGPQPGASTPMSTPGRS